MADITEDKTLAEREEFGGSPPYKARGEHRDDEAGLGARVRSFGTDLRDRNLPLVVANRTALLGIAVIGGALSAFAVVKALDRSRKERTLRARARKQARRLRGVFER